MRYPVLRAGVFSDLFKREHSALSCRILFLIAFLILAGQANAQYVVTNTADTGAGSLRQAIANANAAADLNNITFNIPGAGTHIITITTALVITNPVTIDGYSQPGAAANTSANTFNAKIAIKIFGATPTNGMTIRATGCTISGLSMDEFQTAITIAGSTNQITGNFIGNDPQGTNLNNGNFGNGIVVGSGVGNIIGGTSLDKRNVIASNGNTVGAVFAAIQSNVPVTIEGNFIGVGINGNSDVTHFDPNRNGIFLNAGSAGSVIGGTTAAQRNIISGNYGTQITVGDPATIIGNYIGTDATGIAVDPNVDITTGKVDGIVVTTTTAGTIIGGPAPQSNIISGVSNGVHISGTGATATIQGNYIGSDVSGMNALLSSNGVTVELNCGTVVIGGGTAGQGNVIATSATCISLSSIANIRGNLIGTNSAGSAALGANKIGIYVSTTSGSTIGGPLPGSRNIISGSSQYGIQLQEGATILGNYIGTDINGAIAIPNLYGIYVMRDVAGFPIGGDRPGEGNVISGNTDYGIIDLGGANIEGNKIGTDATGQLAIGNAVGVASAATTTIGSMISGATNIISGNTTGVISSINTSIIANYIGTDISGAIPLPNVTGIRGQGVITANVISGNTGDAIDGSGTSLTINGNIIGLRAAGDIPLANGGGITLAMANAGTAVIGGTATTDKNTISANNSSGITINNASTTSTITIEGNYIGTDITGVTAYGNTGYGIECHLAPSVTIGGDNAGDMNIISGNLTGGIYADGSPIIVLGNHIGTDVNGTGVLGNQNNGIFITSVAGDFTNAGQIGDGTVNGTNVIANNTTGITLSSANVERVSIRHNSMFNQTTGILLLGGANNLILTPSITKLTATTISGTGQSGSTIELFHNTTNDPQGGRTFIGTANVSSNTWSMTGTFTTTDSYTVTETDDSDNTSQFGALSPVIGVTAITPLINGGTFPFGTTFTGAPLSQIFTISNSGAAPLNVTTVAISPSTGYSITGFTPGAISPGSTMTFTVKLVATSAGSFPAVLSINTNDPATPTFAINLSALVNGPEIAVYDGPSIASPLLTDGQTTVVDVGTSPMNTNLNQVFTIQNSGNAALGIFSITVSGGAGYSVVGTPTGISPGGTATFTLVLSGLIPGTFTATVTINNSDADEGVYTFPVTGTITNSAPTVSTIVDQITNEDTPTAAIPFTIGDAETAAAALTVTGSSGDQTIIPNANIVIGGSGANRTIQITPAPNQNGAVTITLNVSDGYASKVAFFQLTVNAVNDPPTISVVANQITNEDTPTAAIPFTVGDIETPAASLIVTASSSNVTIVPNANIVIGGSGANRTVQITSALNQNGIVIITLNVNDGTVTTSETFQLTINAVNDPPTISAVADQTTNENVSTAAIPFTVGDVETPAASLIVTANSGNLTLVPNANIILSGTGAGRTVQITPALNQNGVVSITLNVNDGTVTTSENFQLTVNAVNNPPTISIVADQVTNEDTPTAAIPFTVGDIETPATSLTATASSGNLTIVPNANIVLGGTGANRTVQITPAPNQNGIVTITLNVNDGTVTTSENFQLTINAVNDPPTISVVADQVTNEDTPTAAIPFTVGDVETPAVSLTVTASSGNITIVPNANIVLGGTGANRTIQITPALNQNGIVTITLNVNDGTITTTETFQLTVNAVNDPPTISVVADQITNEDTPTAAIPFTVGDVETPAASLTVTASSSNLTIVPNANIVLGGTGANRTVQISPAPNQNGIITITLNVNDGSVTTSENFQLTINAVNDPPTISVVADQITNEDTPTAAIPFTVGDIETPAASLTVTASSSNITIVPNANIVLGGTGANRTVQITPASNQNGIVTITLNVNDGTVTTTETFQLTINAVNDPPTITPIANQSPNENTATGVLPFTVGDVETPAASLIVTASSNNLTLVPNANILLGGTGANRTVQITPGLNQSGLAIITLTVNDGTTTTSETFQVAVNFVNTPPAITVVADQTTNEDTPTAAIPFTVGDVETPVASLVVTASSSNVAIVPNANIIFGGAGANRTIQITPALNQNGVVTITLNVDDGAIITSETFQLTINPVNDPPTISVVSDQITNEDTPTATIPFTVGDVETPAASLTVTASSSNNTIVPNANIVLGGTGANRTVQITPALNQNGIVTITLNVNDGTVTTSENFQLTINAVNDPPTISVVADQITNEDTPTAALPFTVGDVETPAASLTVTASSGNTTVVPNANIVLGGTGANRTVQITPASNQNGIVTITLNVNDGTVLTTETFQLTINAVNDPPTITAVANQSPNENTSTGVLPFTVGDVETPAGSLIVTASSDNLSLVPNANIALGGSGANRTVQITPGLNQSGLAIITLSVNDGTTTTSETFQVAVNFVNTPPTITAVADQITNEDTPTSAISFTVGDLETPLASLVVTASSGNVTAVPNTNIVLGGTLANRTVQITPAPNQNGIITITLNVNDGTVITSENFQLTINAVNDPPTITPIANQSPNENTATGVLPFTVGDVETPAASLIVTASSDNLTLVPNANILLGGSGANRTIQITPALNQSGLAIITLNVNDGTTTTSETFQVAVNFVNSPPTISVVADQVTNEDTPTATVPFTIGDLETPVASLTVTGSSSNLTIVPNANIVLGGTGANRTIQITPASNQNGIVTITLNVNDGTITTSETFQLTVSAVNDPPTITAVADQGINENTSTGVLSFTIGDVETPAASLIVTASSGNLTLIPNANIVLGGSAANRTIQVTPSLNQSGVAIITLNVNDGTVTTSETFQVSVNFINNAPTITSIADQNINEDTPTSALSFTVGDVETPAASLIVTASSNNTLLIPNGNIQIGGTGANRTVQITPALNQNGNVSITLTVNDGTLTTSTTFQIIVAPVDDAPTITTIADQVVNENITTGVLTFTIGDIDSPINSLVVTTSSDNNVLTPNANIALGGGGVNRTVQITPASNQSGVSNITIQVSDGTLTTSTSFKLTVNVGSDIAPVITGQITLITLEETTLSLNFSNLFVTDPDTNYPNGFTLTVQDGTNYTRNGNSITPAKNFNGDLSVPVYVNDGTFNSNVYNLIVTVTPVNDAPLITGQTHLSTPENTTLQIAFNDLIVVDPDNSYPTGFTLTINDGTNYTHSGTSITPATSFVGTLTVPVSVNDGAASSNVFNLSIDVIGGTPNITVQITAGGQVNATTIKFTPTEVFTGNEATVIIGNTGAGPLIISAIQFDNPDFSLKGNLPPAIEPGQVVTIIIYFEPSTKGEIAGNMTITSNNSAPEYTILLEGTGVADIEVFNVVTANQNGKNDFLKIKNIEFFPDNKVQIFSRWGDNLFSIAQYDNISRVFKGLTDGGKTVPDGTYYYLIDLKDGKKPKTGFFVLKAN